jgi:WD40 repeat protein/Uma2 family endonuclease/energy-coupling factor transporter ATP-binding protein EcfA2
MPQKTPGASPSLTDLLHTARERYRLVHVDETQSVLLLYTERLLRAAGCDALRLRHLATSAELVIAQRPAPSCRLVLAMEYTGAGSATRLCEIADDLGAPERWHLGWDRVPPVEPLGRAADPETTQQIQVPHAGLDEQDDEAGGEGSTPAASGETAPGKAARIVRRSLREAVYRECQEALSRALRLLINEWEAAPESVAFVDLLLRDNAPDPRPAPAEEALRRFVLAGPEPRPARPGRSPARGRALRDHPVFLLVGAPGSGKSTLLRHFAVTLAREHLAELGRPDVRARSDGKIPFGRIPVLLSLAHEAVEEGDPDDGPGELDRLLEGAVPGLSGKMVRLWAELGLCVLLVDGPLPAGAVARLQQLPTLLPDAPPKTVLSARAHYFSQARASDARLIDEAVQQGWDLGFLEPLSDELLQLYLQRRLPDPVTRSAALSQLARSDNLRRLCRRPGLLAALTDPQPPDPDPGEAGPLLGMGVEKGRVAPSLARLHRALQPAWMEGVAGDRRIERTAREVLARVLARKLRAGQGAVPWWDLLPEIGAEVPSEPDGARLLLHVLRALDDTMFVLMPGGARPHDTPRLRFALPSAADYFTGEDIASRLTTVPVGAVTTCLQRGPGRALRAAALSPSGRLCATGGDEGVVRLWEAGTGFLLRPLSGHQGAISALAFSADETLVFSAARDFTVRLWEAHTGRLARTLCGHTDAVIALSYAPAAEVLASASLDGTVRLWQVPGGRCLRALPIQTECPLTAVGLSADGLLCAVSATDGLVHVLYARSGELITVLGGHAAPVRCLALSPDGRLCASGSDDRSIRLTEVRTGTLLQVLRAHDGPISALSFSADARLLCAASLDRTVRVFELPGSGEHTPARVLHCGREHVGPVTAAAFAPPVRPPRGPSSLASPPAGASLSLAAGQRPFPALLISVSEDGAALLRDGQSGRTLRPLGEAGGAPEAALLVRGLALSRDGEVAAAAGGDGVLRLWDPRKGRVLHELRGHDAGLRCVAFSPDGRTLASGSEDQSVCLWDRQSGELIDRFEGHFSDVVSVAFSPDGYLLASGSADQTIRIREAQGGMMIRTLSSPAGLRAVLFSPDGHHLAGAGTDGAIRIWETTVGTPVQLLRKHLGRVLALCVSPDGRLWASAGDDHLVRVWDAQRGRPMHALWGHTASVRALAFSPDGQILASAGQDRAVRLWEARSGRALRTLSGAPAPLHAIGFLGGSRLLIGGGPEGLLIWHVGDGRILGQLCALGEGWLAQAPVLPESSPPRMALFHAPQEVPAALRMTDGLVSYPASGWARLCQRPQQVVQTLAGHPLVSLEAIQEDLAAAPVPMPVLESSGSKATPLDRPAPAVFLSGGLGGPGETQTSYGRRLTADEMLSPEATARGELARGEVVPLAPVTYAAGRVTGRLHAFLVLHAFGKNLGDLPSSGTGYLLQRDPDVLRKPDVSFVSRERVLQGGAQGFFTGAPDLAAEVISPSNPWEAAEQKAQEYLSTGARLVWVLDPQTRTVHVHESPVRVRILGEADQLTGGAVLPGFAVQLRDLFG